MADPTIGLTFQDFILRVAEYLGVAYYGVDGSQAAQVPTNAHDLDLCKRVVNDGYRRFINSYGNWNFLTPLISVTFSPSYSGTATGGSTTTVVDTTRTEATGFFNGMNIAVTASDGTVQVASVTSWNASTHTFTFPAVANAIVATNTYTVAPSQCVAGDASRYYLPDGFYGSILTPWTYPPNFARIGIETINEGRIRELVAGSGNTVGQPRLVAVRPLAADVTTNGKRWEAIFWPAPNMQATVTCRARLYPNALVNLTDRHIAGFEHDDAIMACAVAEAERERDDRIGPRDANAQAAIGRSRDLDKQASPKRLGDYGDRSDDMIGRQGKRPLNYYSVDTYNGLPV